MITKIHKLTRAEKLYLLRTLIELNISLCFDITHIIGKPLSYFDFDKVEELIIKRRKEVSIMNGEIEEETEEQIIQQAVESMEKRFS